MLSAVVDHLNHREFILTNILETTSKNMAGSNNLDGKEVLSNFLLTRYDFMGVQKSEFTPIPMKRKTTKSAEDEATVKKKIKEITTNMEYINYVQKKLCKNHKNMERVINKTFQIWKCTIPSDTQYITNLSKVSFDNVSASAGAPLLWVANYNIDKLFSIHKDVFSIFNTYKQGGDRNKYVLNMAKIINKSAASINVLSSSKTLPI